VGTLCLGVAAKQRGGPGGGGPGEYPGAPPPAPSPPAMPATEQPASPPDPAAAPPASPEPTPPPDPLASLDPGDRPVAEKIRDLLASKPDIFASKKEYAAVEAFYKDRNLAPLWLDKGIENARAKAVIARLKHADADGLDVADYRTPNFAGLSVDALAAADLKLSQTVVTFARHLQAGRFPYNRVTNNIQLPQQPPEPGAVLTRIANA